MGGGEIEKGVAFVDGGDDGMVGGENAGKMVMRVRRGWWRGEKLEMSGSWG